MDLENELRQAMAEHVTEVSAPGTLAADAKHRHHRTVRRRTALVAGAAGLVVVGVAMVPAYQSFRPKTVGADGHEGRGHNGHTIGTPPAASPTTPALRPHTGSGSKGSHHSPKPGHPASPHLPGLTTVKSLLGYVPAGISPDKTCHTSHAGSTETTSCRWSGSGGWVEVRLVHGGGLKTPADLGLAPPMSKNFKVHGRPALLSQLPSQVMWIERPGLGVWVGVSPSLNGSLGRVAEGVNVT